MTAFVITLLLSAAGCGAYLWLARRRQWLDQPNQRSSHTRPTPHGGGLPMLLAFAAGMALVQLGGTPWPVAYWLLLIVALVLMAIGVLDDRRGLPVSRRLLLYFACCVLVAWELLPAAGWPLLALAAIALLWLVNLYNFMDGIDGIAGLQCLLACAGAALLAWFGAGAADYVVFCLLLAAAQLGFLLWNWPPARLFMGDAGSVPTGLLLGGLALLGAAQDIVPLAAWLILLAAFITDASATLLLRIRRGEHPGQAHRQHAYQRLSRHWDSHLPVDLLLLAVNALWLFPLAFAATMWPKFGILLVILSYMPLLAGVAKSQELG